MPNQRINSPMPLHCGLEMKNRYALAPLTNSQSNEDGTMSDEEYHWLTMRAKGGFGLVMTCASHVHPDGKGFPGQLGIFSDDHLPGLTRLAEGINNHGALSIVQLHHAGIRSPKKLISGSPIGPSEHVESDARGISHVEVKQLIQDFIDAAARAQQAGFHGAEIHGAHGYILSAFMDADINHRHDEYGGSIENRSRILFEIIDGIRQRCGEHFCLGLRLSVEGYGTTLPEMIWVCKTILDQSKIDFLDLSLWDSFKEPEEETFQGRTLLSYFTELDRNTVKLGVAGKLMQPEDIEKIMSQDIDFILLGKAAILQHDFPQRYANDPTFIAPTPPVSASHLASEGLSSAFITYMQRWKNFVTK